MPSSWPDAASISWQCAVAGRKESLRPDEQVGRAVWRCFLTIFINKINALQGIYTAWFGPYPNVIITDYDLMREAFIGNGTLQVLDSQ